MITALIYALKGALTFRIRGGLRIPHTDKKFPLNKWWFAVFFAFGACYLKGWSSGLGLTCLIAGYMCTAVSGWGSYIGALYSGVVSDDKDDLNITAFVQDVIFGKILKKDYREYGKLYGFFTLSLRGGLTTFLLGLAINSVPYMFVGLLQGTVYWLGGWTCRHVYDDGKYGWRWAEIFWGMTLGIFLNLFA